MRGILLTLLAAEVLGAPLPGLAEEGGRAPGSDTLAVAPSREPAQAPGSVPATFRWGAQHPDLLRYNRVEGWSVGARGQLRPDTPAGPISLTLTARLGTGDRVPNARFDAYRESLERRLTVSAFHELASVEEDAGHLGIGNSLMAALFGRDDGEYYRRTGVGVEWTPPAAVRRSFVVRGFAEEHRSVEPHTRFALWHVGDSAWAFRENVVAAPGREIGGLLRLSPWWGSDPLRPQGGLDVTLQGAGGDFEYLRASAVAGSALPLPGDLVLEVEAGGGTAWGSPPPQRLWWVGGATTARGFPPAVLGGRSFLRARGEMIRPFAFGSVGLFADAAWAGERGEIHLAEDALASVGVGVGLVDGLIRLDVAHPVRQGRGVRAELYLDAVR